MYFKKASDITDKNIFVIFPSNKFVMKIQSLEILKSLGFCINLLFENLENCKTKRGKITVTSYPYLTAMNNAPFTT